MRQVTPGTGDSTSTTGGMVSSKKPWVHASQEAGPSGDLFLETLSFTRHEHLVNKVQNRSPQPGRPYLILGDSNISKLPAIYHSEVQVDCLPGARIHYITRVLKHKTPVSSMVRAVVLSVGINDHNQNSRFQSNKVIQALMEAADSTFPNAKIRIAAHWSRKLPLPIRSNLVRIDEAIRRTERRIKRLPGDDFVTEDDQIHWTTTTAEKIWRH